MELQFFILNSWEWLITERLGLSVTVQFKLLFFIFSRKTAVSTADLLYSISDELCSIPSSQVNRAVPLIGLNFTERLSIEVFHAHLLATQWGGPCITAVCLCQKQSLDLIKVFLCFYWTYRFVMLGSNIIFTKTNKFMYLDDLFWRLLTTFTW